MELIGLANCDSCRAARRALEEAGHVVVFRDVRKSPLSRDEIRSLLGDHGEALVNRRSTTWRGLDEAERGTDPIDLLTRYPALMKRPVIRRDGQSWLGWTGAVRAALGLG